MTAAAVLPADHAWHQSSVSLLLRCSRRFYFRHVLKQPPDDYLTGFARQLGIADHAAIDLILQRANEGEAPRREQLLDVMLAAFADAVARSAEKGETANPDGVDAAVERLEGERLERLLVLADDPRIHAIEWRGIEERFEFQTRHGRRWKGTIDAWGVAREFVADFGAEGRDPVDLYPGDALVVDWKTGDPQPFGYPERALSVQLGIYAMALSRELRYRWRTFLAYTQDLDRPKAPTDDAGKRIPKRLPKQTNPAYAVAVTERLSLTEADIEAAKKSKKRPRDAAGKAIPKWLPEQINPAFTAAINKPKGPLFREASVNYPLVLETVSSAISQAEAGLFPANGAATGQCRGCPYSSVCNQQETQ